MGVRLLLQIPRMSPSSPTCRLYRSQDQLALYVVAPGVVVYLINGLGLQPVDELQVNVLFFRVFKLIHLVSAQLVDVLQAVPDSLQPLMVEQLLAWRGHSAYRSLFAATDLCLASLEVRFGTFATQLTLAWVLMRPSLPLVEMVYFCDFFALLSNCRYIFS